MATYWENSCSFSLRYVSWYKCLIVSLVFSHLGFWSGNLFLIAPFPDLCLLVPFYYSFIICELCLVHICPFDSRFIGRVHRHFRDIRSDFKFLFQFSMKFIYVNRKAPGKTPHFAASHLGLYCYNQRTNGPDIAHLRFSL